MKCLENIDWKLLREQKSILVDLKMNDNLMNMEIEALEGIISLIDEMQDEKAEEIGEEEVFGRINRNTVRQLWNKYFSFMEKPDNLDSIIEWVADDIQETADIENWNDSDFTIAVRRYFELKD